MATYSELDELGRSPALRDKVRASIAVAANTIRLEDPLTDNHAVRLAWAKAAVLDLNAELERFMPMVLAANVGALKEDIENASDSAIQTNVDNVVNFFAI